MIKKSLALTSIAIAAMAVAGCSSLSLSREAKEAYTKNLQQANAAMQAQLKQTSFNVNDGRYVDTQAHVVHPSWEYHRVEMHAYQQPLAVVMNQLTQDTGIELTYTDNLDNTLVNISYRGNLMGALKQIMAKNNIYFDIDQSDFNSITWSKKETKTFNIAYLPGTTSFNMSGSSSASGSSDGGTSSGSNNISGSVNVWDDIKQTLDTMKSKSGNYSIDQSDSTITVTDTPQNVQKISKFITNYNVNLSKRVNIKVKIIEVNLNKQHQYGLDWNLIVKGVTYGGMTGSASTAIPGYAYNVGQKLGGNDDSDASTHDLGAGNSNGDLAGSSALMNVFDEQGKTTVVNEPTITSLNNSPNVIAVNDKRAYIKNSSVTDDDGGNNGQPKTTYTETPDNVITGLNMTLIPHIKGNQVFMSIQGSVSSLVNMKQRSFGYVNGHPAVEMDLPETANKSFSQAVMVENGHIIAMSGLKTKKNSDNKTKNFYLSPMGQRIQLSDENEMVILIQPTIVR